MDEILLVTDSCRDRRVPVAPAKPTAKRKTPDRQKKVSDQEDKITRYRLDIKKKQQRLEELDLMRSAINVKIQTDSIPVIQQ